MTDKLLKDTLSCFPAWPPQMFGYLHPSISKDAETTSSIGVEKEKVPRVVGRTESTPYSQRVVPCPLLMVIF